MGGRQVGHPGSDAAETVIPIAADAANSIGRRNIGRRNILRLGAVAALLVVVAVPLLFEADIPSVAANSTLKCYDRYGSPEPCVTQASAFPSRFDGRTMAAPQPAPWTAIAAYQPRSWTASPRQQASWATTGTDQQVSWATTAVDQQASGASAAVDQSANSATTAAARRAALKRRALAKCRRNLIPCFFSTLRKGLTHIATAVAAAGQARPAKERL